MISAADAQACGIQWKNLSIFRDYVRQNVGVDLEGLPPELRFAHVHRMALEWLDKQEAERGRREHEARSSMAVADQDRDHAEQAYRATQPEKRLEEIIPRPDTTGAAPGDEVSPLPPRRRRKRRRGKNKGQGNKPDDWVKSGQAPPEREPPAPDRHVSRGIEPRIAQSYRPIPGQK